MAQKMYGGLIRREKRVKRDERGHVTTQHWDGRKDVTIHAERATLTARPKSPGGEN